MKNKPSCFLLLILVVFTSGTLYAQNNLKVRIAKIIIDSAYLHDYRAAVLEHTETAVKAEPGVLTLNVVYDKENPTHITVFEVYAGDSAYQAHIKTPHFLKYKTVTLKMVKSLELVDVVPIALESKLTANQETRKRQP